MMHTGQFGETRPKKNRAQRRIDAGINKKGQHKIGRKALMITIGKTRYIIKPQRVWNKNKKMFVMLTHWDECRGVINSFK